MRCLMLQPAPRSWRRLPGPRCQLLNVPLPTVPCLVQGSLLSALLAEPLHLASITVSLQPPAGPAPVPEPEAAPEGEPSPGPEPSAEVARAQELPPPPSCASSAAELAAAALHRAVVGRTAVLVEEGRAGIGRPVAPALHIHVPKGAVQSSHLPRSASHASGIAAEPVVRGTPAASGSAQCLQELGLAPSAARRVGSGASIVWFAPPSPAFKWKPASRQQPLPPQAGAAAGGSSAAGAAAPPAVLTGGTAEAVAGTTGLKVGASKARPAQPVHPAAQSAVCKAALFAAWHRLSAALGQLPAGPPAGAIPDAVEAQPEGEVACGSMTYRQAKLAGGPAYVHAWRLLREPPSPFEGWIPKPPDLEEFLPGC